MIDLLKSFLRLDFYLTVTSALFISCAVLLYAIRVKIASSVAKKAPADDSTHDPDEYFVRPDPLRDRVAIILNRTLPLDRHKTWIFRIATIFAVSIFISLLGIEWRDWLGREKIRSFIDTNLKTVSVFIDGKKTTKVNDWLQSLHSTQLVFHGAGTSHPMNKVTVALSTNHGEQINLIVGRDSKDRMMYWVIYPQVSGESPVGWTFSNAVLIIKFGSVAEFMRYIVAILGAGFILISVYLICLVLMPYLPEFLRGYYIIVWPVATNNILGLILSPLAAAASFRGTLRHYENRDLRAKDLTHSQPNRNDPSEKNP